MKVLVIGHLTGKDIRPYLEAEGRTVAGLRADGLIRDVFLKSDRTGPILLLNDTTATEAPGRPGRSASRGRARGAGSWW
jgi:hypothetical protein